MLIHIEHMRLVAVEILLRPYQIFGFPMKLVKAKLNLPSEADAETLIKAAGFHRAKNPQRGSVYEKRPDTEDWKQTWKKWR